MLTSLFDLQLATYPNFPSFDPREAAKADLVQIEEFVPGGIYHPIKVIWRLRIDTTENFEDTISSSRERKALRENEQWLHENGYTVYSHPVTREVFDKFYELYKRTTLQKDRAIDYVRYSLVTEHEVAGHEVVLMGYEKDGQYVSAHFCFVDKGRLNLAYSAVEHFPDLRGGLGGIIHKHLFAFAKERNLSYMSHGSSMNPMGLTSSAGLFEFKARYGYSGYPGEQWITTFLLTPAACARTLVFNTVGNETLIQKVVSLEEPISTKAYMTEKVPTVVWASAHETMLQSRSALNLAAYSA